MPPSLVKPGLQPHLREAIASRTARQARHARGLAPVAVGASEGFPDDLLLVMVQAHAFGQEKRESLCAQRFLTRRRGEAEQDAEKPVWLLSWTRQQPKLFEIRDTTVYIGLRYRSTEERCRRWKCDSPMTRKLLSAGP